LAWPAHLMQHDMARVAFEFVGAQHLWAGPRAAVCRAAAFG
jgi:hypothetical protein